MVGVVQGGGAVQEDRARRGSGYGRSVKLSALLGAVVVLAVGCSKAAPEPTPPAQQQPQAGSKQLTIWLTGYSWQDNTPPGSSVVGEPVLHKQADGQ
ncbi:MAG: hypothetical protein QOE32_6727, partial [Pseudonocardiales bacterium]|nr:hypothetical protein [Pseudonocardiales bacterium]